LEGIDPREVSQLERELLAAHRYGLRIRVWENSTKDPTLKRLLSQASTDCLILTEIIAYHLLRELQHSVRFVDHQENDEHEMEELKNPAVSDRLKKKILGLPSEQEFEVSYSRLVRLSIWFSETEYRTIGCLVLALAYAQKSAFFPLWRMAHGVSDIRVTQNGKHTSTVV